VRPDAISPFIVWSYVENLSLHLVELFVKGCRGVMVYCSYESEASHDDLLDQNRPIPTCSSEGGLHSDIPCSVCPW
jgi:hypothetical protein